MHNTLVIPTAQTAVRPEQYDHDIKRMIIGLMVSLVIVCIFIATVLGIAALTSHHSAPVTLTRCSNYVAKQDLAQITERTPRCIRDGQVTDLYYVPELDYVVGSAPVMPQSAVCRFFCKDLTDGVCTGEDYDGYSAQHNYDACMKRLVRTDCIPPVPLAVRGGDELFYAVSPTGQYCDNIG